MRIEVGREHEYINETIDGIFVKGKKYKVWKIDNENRVFIGVMYILKENFHKYFKEVKRGVYL